jgi:hypothetical protein
MEAILDNAFPMAAAFDFLNFKDFVKELKMDVDMRRFNTLLLGEGVFLMLKRVLLVVERALGEMDVR